MSCRLRRTFHDGEAVPRRYCSAGGSDIFGTVDDFWVVPYYPALSSMVHSHLIGELCIIKIGEIK